MNFSMGLKFVCRPIHIPAKLDEKWEEKIFLEGKFKRVHNFLQISEIERPVMKRI